MGAAGVKAFEVKKRTGFEVLFATLRIEDLPAYLDNGLTAAPGMRELTFGIRERFILTPIEIVSGMKSVLPLGAPLAVLAGFVAGNFFWHRSLVALLLYSVAVLCGTFVAPLLLPFLPGRMFALKGACTGLVVALSVVSLLFGTYRFTILEACSTILIMSAVSAFYTMNFTGSTPYTSPSGVRKEMKYSLPIMLASSLFGVLLILLRVVLP
jgi:acetyl-CoA decarbonylase/synthase complex subunit gamma